jgi:hypothetical protein
MARLSRSSPTCARAARAFLVAFMDAVVIVDPVQYSAAATSVMTSLCRCAHCISARTAGAWSGSWFIRLMISCL